MISMNCRPPRAIATTRPAMLPAVNALIRNKVSRNIGSATLPSITAKAASSRTPPMMHP
jgi:hypothetical protein